MTSPGQRSPLTWLLAGALVLLVGSALLVPSRRPPDSPPTATPLAPREPPGRPLGATAETSPGPRPAASPTPAGVETGGTPPLPETALAEAGGAEPVSEASVRGLEAEADLRPGDALLSRRLSHAYLVLAERLREQGRGAEALTYLERALARDPTDDSARLLAAAIDLDLDRKSEARDMLARVGGGGRAQAGYHRMMGGILYAAEDLTGALAELRQAQRISGDPTLDSTIARIEREIAAAPSGGQSIEGRRFEIVFEGRENAAAARLVVDALEGIYDELKRDFSLDDFTVTTVMYADRDFREVTGAPDWASAIYDGKIRVPVAGLTAVDPELRRTLKHEMTHAFVARKGGAGVPRWLHEGLAQYYSGSRIQASRLAPAARAVVAAPDEPSDPRLFYSQALLRVEYLIERRRAVQVMALLEELRQGATFPAAFSRALNLEWDRFLDEFNRATAGPA